MARYALINAGRVTNIVLGDEIFAALVAAENELVLNIDGAVTQPSIGWSYTDGAFVPPPVVVPKEVTPRQMRQALILSGVPISSIDAAINSLPEPKRSLVLVEWEYSNSFIRNNPLVETVGLMLGWSPAQLDGLWKLAQSL